MEINIKPNIYFYFRIILLIACMVIFAGCVNASVKAAAYVPLGFCLFLFPVGFCELIKGIFFTPSAVNISYDTIRIRYWLSGSRTITPDNIAGYSTTLYNTKLKNFSGIVIYLKNKKHFELSKYNLKTMQPVIQYFTQHEDILHFGNERSHISFFSVKYKYKTATPGKAA